MRHRSRTSRLLAALLGAVTLLCGCGDADSRGATIERFRVAGLEQVAVIPGGAPPEGERGLVVFFHGRGGHAREQLRNERLFAALEAAGSRAPVFLFAASDEDSYWHDRRERRWGRYLWRRVIPEAVRRLGIDRRRMAVGGISMGGFGAWDLARLHPGGFCAAAGHSPAIWRAAGETAPGAFDDAADFGRHDLVRAAARRPEVYARTRHLWLDIGTADPFVPGVRALAANLRRGGVRLTFKRWPGGHDGDYWRAHWPAYVRFYARALADC
jgi:enterochelin esterase-like enzyme